MDDTNDQKMNNIVDEKMTYVMHQIESAIIFYASMTRSDKENERVLMNKADRLFKEAINKLLGKYLNKEN